MFVNLCLSFQVIYWCLKLDVEIACCMSEGGSRGYVLSLLAPSLLISAASRRRRQWHPTPVLCLERPMDGGAWWAAVHGVSKSWTQLSDFPFTFHFHTLEKEMATHSSVLAWRIPGTGEPGGLPSMGSHRVRHDWSDLAAAAAGFCQGFPGGSDGKESACNARDLGLIPGSGRSPGEGNGYPLQYSCLGNPMDKGAWQATVHGVAKSLTQFSD